jgi:hypothetical protein
MTVIASPTSTPAPTLTVHATNIPVPTLATENREEAVGFLFATNNYCDFPCWWGIIPGKTTWMEAEKFLKPLVLEIKQRDASRFSGMVVHGIDIEVPQNIDADGIESIGFLENTDGMIFWISLSTSLREMGLDISSFLMRYGPPSEVYISATGYDSISRDEGRYSVAFYYETKGILVHYDGSTFMGNKMINICSSEYLNSDAFLVFWDPVEELSFETVGLGTESVDFSPLAEISNQTSTTLYEFLKNTWPQEYCFEIENPGYPN